MDTPPAIIGLRHVALNVDDIEACEHFYIKMLGYRVEWRPDDDNLYLTSGTDNLALHRAQNTGRQSRQANGRSAALDHVGIILRRADDVDAWHRFLSERDVVIEAPPKTHRDGARSFYCRDPAGNRVQMIYHPPLADT